MGRIKTPTQMPPGDTVHPLGTLLTETIGVGSEDTPRAHGHGSDRAQNGSKDMDKIHSPTKERVEAKATARTTRVLGRARMFTVWVKRVWHHFRLLHFLHNRALETHHGHSCSPLFRRLLHPQSTCQLPR